MVEESENGGTTTKEVPAEREITVRDLLRHTSGFTYGFFGDTEVDKRYRSALVLITDRTLEDTITKLAALPLLYQPATRWHYSVSTDVLGRVIEVASGTTLDQYFQEQIFTPLGMHDTFFTVPEEKLPRLAQMYSPDDNGGLKPANPMQSLRFVTPANRFYSGGGGLCSTATDYLAFCQMLLNNGTIWRPTDLKAGDRPRDDDGPAETHPPPVSRLQVRTRLCRRRFGCLRLGRRRRHQILDRPPQQVDRHLHGPNQSHRQIRLRG